MVAYSRQQSRYFHLLQQRLLQRSGCLRRFCAGKHGANGADDGRGRYRPGHRAGVFSAFAHRYLVYLPLLDADDIAAEFDECLCVDNSNPALVNFLAVLEQGRLL